MQRKNFLQKRKRRLIIAENGNALKYKIPI